MTVDRARLLLVGIAVAAYVATPGLRAQVTGIVVFATASTFLAAIVAGWLRVARSRGSA